ncbi:Phage integrase SAM-like domain containing protein [uncultured Caudovirales phage]|uniref:Phage integrase SAM-like domain containing protein n=1 Tax=uncultured Caudovirales phage TaxID=2100421 RepID=A0A6J5KYX4_9CAUD|nr:Phage integrase SAM-like domain containing protein [uncultured Caudovirales phage]
MYENVVKIYGFIPFFPTLALHQRTTPMAKAPNVILALVKKYAADSEGYIKIKVNIPGKRKPAMKSTGYRIPEKMWLAEEELVKKAHPDAQTINREIHKEKDKIIDAFKTDLQRDNVFTEALIKKRVAGRTQTDFLEFYQEYIDFKKKDWSDGFCRHQVSNLNTLRKFTKGSLPFSDINTDWLEAYEMSMAKLQSTTVNTKFKRLREVVSRAIKRKLIDEQAIMAYKWPEYGQPETDYLTLSQTEDLADLIYTGKLDYDTKLKNVACYFLLECYSGIRFSDWSRWKIETLVSDRNLKVRAKKNGEPVYLPLNIFTRLGRIVDYILDSKIPPTTRERDTNLTLKVLERHEKLQWNLGLHSHVGRHTCATILGEMGYTDNDIAEVLGISPQTARKYTKRTRQGLNATFAEKGGI